MIRFAGLYGKNRQIGTSWLNLTRQVDGTIPSPEKRLNLIHQDDCVGIIQRIIECNLRGEIMNACCDVHPTREELYRKAALKRKESSVFTKDSASSGKIVSNQKLRKLLNYTFQHPNPLEAMDLLVNPLNQQLVVNPDHPNFPVALAK